MSKANDLTGLRVGRLVVKERCGHHRKEIAWLCECDCGNKIVRPAHRIKTAAVKSCGCLTHDNKPSLRHGLADTPIHMSWMAMRQRCLNPKNKAYKNYGGRGITICERWNTFENFLADMGNKPEGFELERIDVNGNYEPSNCKWATPLEQSRNRRVTVFVELDGKRRTLKEWAIRFGIKYHTAYARYTKGIAGKDLFKRAMTAAEASKLGIAAQWGIRNERI